MVSRVFAGVPPTAKDLNGRVVDLAARHQEWKRPLLQQFEGALKRSRVDRAMPDNYRGEQVIVEHRFGQRGDQMRTTRLRRTAD